MTIKIFFAIHRQAQFAGGSSECFKPSAVLALGGFQDGKTNRQQELVHCSANAGLELVWFCPGA